MNNIELKDLKLISLAVTILIALGISISCQPKKLEDVTTSTTLPSTDEGSDGDSDGDAGSTTADKYLYFSSGACKSGAGVTTFSPTTSSNLIVKVNLTTGAREDIIADFQGVGSSPGDSPIGIIDWDDNNLLTVIGTGTTGRIEIVPKNKSSRSLFGTNPGAATIFTTIPRFLNSALDGGFFASRSTVIDKISRSGIRLNGPAAAATYVTTNLSATCGTTNTAYNFAVQSPSGKIITGHGFAATNRLISLSSAGGSGSCLFAQAAPGAGTAWPLAAVYDSANNKLIVAWGNSATTANTNMIISYDYNDTTGAFGTANTLYDISGSYSYLIFNASAMYLDTTDNHLYVATAISTATTVVNYAIEKFKYDPTKIGVANSQVLTRVGSVPFYNYGLDTKCISSIVVGK